LYIRIGPYFIDITQIDRVAVVSEDDPREQKSYRVVRIWFENEGQTETVTLSEAEAAKSAFLQPFVAGRAAIRL
jgi:hypothetical protein